MTDHRREADLAELATGAAVGAERAVALQHVVTCGGCLQELAQLSRAADELLALAPHQEPPAGFESTVIAQMTPHDPPPPRPWLRILLSLAAAILAAVFGASAVWLATAGDRHAAQEQRTTLEISGGTHFTARPILTVNGSRAGTVFVYEGNPSWLMISLDGAPVDGAYRMVVYDRDGATYYGDSCDVEQGVGMDGYRLFRSAGALASVELIGPDGIRLTARF